MEPSNEERAERAFTVIEGYAGNGLDYRTSIVDLLTDLRHLCEQEGISFEDCSRTARSHYDEEATNEQDR